MTDIQDMNESNTKAVNKINAINVTIKIYIMRRAIKFIDNTIINSDINLITLTKLNKMKKEYKKLINYISKGHELKYDALDQDYVYFGDISDNIYKYCLPGVPISKYYYQQFNWIMLRCDDHSIYYGYVYKNHEHYEYHNISTIARVLIGDSGSFTNYD